MIEELQGMREELFAADEELTLVTFGLLNKWGLTREMVQAEAER